MHVLAVSSTPNAFVALRVSVGRGHGQGLTIGIGKLAPRGPCGLGHVAVVVTVVRVVAAARGRFLTLDRVTEALDGTADAGKG